VVDDDESVREALPDLLRSFGLEAAGFASAKEFLASDSLDRTGCLVLDVAMPDMTGPELQEELVRQQRRIPVVFITAHSEQSALPALQRRDTVACLFKPFSETAIFQAVNEALQVG
jgi:FixJ family two-component response regulator